MRGQQHYATEADVLRECRRPVPVQGEGAEPDNDRAAGLYVGRLVRPEDLHRDYHQQDVQSGGVRRRRNSGRRQAQRLLMLQAERGRPVLSRHRRVHVLDRNAVRRGTQRHLRSGHCDQQECEAL